MIKIFYFIKRLLNHPNKLKYFLCRLLLRTNLGRFLKIKRNGYTVRLSENNVASEMFIQGKNFYHDEEKFIKSLIKNDSTFIDIGANIGNLSLAAANIINDGKIIAIEAHPKTYRSMLQNINDNAKNIDAYNLAVGDESGEIYLTDFSADDCNHISKENINNNVAINIDTIDNILGYDVGKIDLLKIDVEGFELMVLKGAKITLSKTKYIYFELWDKLTEKFKYSGSEIIDLLRKHNFKIFNLNNFAIGDEVKKRQFPEIGEYLAISNRSK